MNRCQVQNHLGWKLKTLNMNGSAKSIIIIVGTLPEPCVIFLSTVERRKMYLIWIWCLVIISFFFCPNISKDRT